jgi:hypothetical protein
VRLIPKGGKPNVINLDWGWFIAGDGVLLRYNVENPIININKPTSVYDINQIPIYLFQLSTILEIKSFSARNCRLFAPKKRAEQLVVSLLTNGGSWRFTQPFFPPKMQCLLSSQALRVALGVLGPRDTVACKINLHPSLAGFPCEGNVRTSSSHGGDVTILVSVLLLLIALIHRWVSPLNYHHTILNRKKWSFLGLAQV